MIIIAAKKKAWFRKKHLVGLEFIYGSKFSILDYCDA
jgi:hypothetical protein